MLLIAFKTWQESLEKKEGCKLTSQKGGEICLVSVSKTYTHITTHCIKYNKLLQIGYEMYRCLKALSANLQAPCKKIVLRHNNPKCVHTVQELWCIQQILLIACSKLALFINWWYQHRITSFPLVSKTHCSLKGGGILGDKGINVIIIILEQRSKLFLLLFKAKKLI